MKSTHLGPVMICAGAEEAATTCQRMVLASGVAVRLMPGPGIGVTGRCILGEVPVAGASVGMFPRGLDVNRSFLIPLVRRGDTVVRHVVTGPDGRFSFPQIASGDYQLEIQAPGGRIQHPSSVSVPPSSTSYLGKERKALDLGDILLEPGVDVEVRVTDGRGDPVQGAVLRAAQGERGPPTYFKSSTGNDGRAVLSGFDASREVRITAQAAGYLLTEKFYSQPPPLAELELVAASSLVGRVLDMDGSPLVRAIISLKDRSISAGVGEDGSFVLHDLEPGVCVLRAVAAGYAIRDVSLLLTSGELTDLGSVVLDLGAQIQGVVRDSSTLRPIAGARVKATDPPGAFDLFTGEKGEFEVAESPSGSVAVTASAPGYVSLRTSLSAQGTQGALQIHLSRGGWIEAVAWDEEDDRPCVSCSVLVQGPSEFQTITTDFSGSGRSDPLTPGVYHVSTQKARSMGSVVELRGGDRGRSVEVKENAVTRVELGQKPLKVRVRFIGLPRQGWTLVAKSLSRHDVVAPGGDGVFVIGKPRGEAVALDLSDGRVTQIHQTIIAADDPRSEVEIALPLGSISGVVHCREQAVSYAELDLLSANGLVRARTRTDESGSFLILFTPPDNYLLLRSGTLLRPFTLNGESSIDLGELTVNQ